MLVGPGFQTARTSHAASRDVLFLQLGTAGNLHMSGLYERAYAGPTLFKCSRIVEEVT